MLTHGAGGKTQQQSNSMDKPLSSPSSSLNPSLGGTSVDVAIQTIHNDMNILKRKVETIEGNMATKSDLQETNIKIDYLLQVMELILQKNGLELPAR